MVVDWARNSGVGVEILVLFELYYFGSTLIGDSRFRHSSASAALCTVQVPEVCMRDLIVVFVWLSSGLVLICCWLLRSRGSSVSPQ